MGEVIFCKTNDGSVGLYNESVNDIYHSSYGAYGEGLEKFILASDFHKFIQENDDVNVLDICYGIGYNTKIAIDEILKNGKSINANFDCLEYDENLITISPLLKNQKIDNFINLHLIENSNLKISMSVFQILKFIIEARGISCINWSNLLKMCEIYHNSDMFLYLSAKINAFLHNIYYNYITSSNKKSQKTTILDNVSVKFHSNDARKSVLTLGRKYDFIFLDAFTPKKLPTLWSFEFLKVLYNLLNDNGVLVTYSSSASVRSALVDIGFYIGKSLDANGKIIGTIATKNKSLIKNELNDFEKELLSTTAGVYYRDENLSDTPENMIKRRDNEALNSGRKTSSRLKKDYAKKI